METVSPAVGFLDTQPQLPFLKVDGLEIFYDPLLDTRDDDLQICLEKMLLWKRLSLQGARPFSAAKCNPSNN